MQRTVALRVLTPAAQPRAFRGGRVVIAGPVDALDGLIAVNYLENLADQCTRFLGRILCPQQKQTEEITFTDA